MRHNPPDRLTRPSLPPSDGDDRRRAALRRALILVAHRLIAEPSRLDERLTVPGGTRADKPMREADREAR